MITNRLLEQEPISYNNNTLSSSLVIGLKLKRFSIYVPPAAEQQQSEAFIRGVGFLSSLQ